MDEMEITQPEEIVEVSAETESPAMEEQSLADATYDAGARVEQIGDYEQSEVVEATFTEIVDSMVEAPQQTPVEESKIPQEIDPLTGQSKPGDSSTDETDIVEEPLQVDEDQSQIESPGALAETVDDVDRIDDRAVTDQETDAQRIGEDYGNTATITDEGTPETQVAVGEKPTGVIEDEGIDAGQIQTPQIERQIPEEEILADGMIKGGLMPQGESEKQTHDMGKGTSGGGPPVTGKSGKSVDIMVPGKSDTGRYLDIESMKNDGGVVPSSDGKGYWEKQDNGDWYFIEYETDDEDPPDAGTAPEPGGVYGLTPDGSTPMPYTGSTYGGEPTDLSHQSPAGPDECGFLRMIVGGERHEQSYYGYGSSGSVTFSPSGGGETDDSGKYYGGLFGGGSIQDINPDDFDYYTPNVLSEALAKAQME